MVDKMDKKDDKKVEDDKKKKKRSMAETMYPTKE